MFPLGNELQCLNVSKEIVFLGPSIHIVSHFVRTEVRDKYFLCADDELDASKPF